MKPVLLVLTLVVSSLLMPRPGQAEVAEDDLGVWYMYFWGAKFNDSNWGAQGDVQYRNWDTVGDIEQLLIRGGVTYSPDSSNALFTLGYANVTSGAVSDRRARNSEDRIYQEALLPQKIGARIYLRHRFRFEQRWVDNQDFRTRFRYALFMDIPLNQTGLKKGAWYLAFYNEIFINGENDIGDGSEVELYDRDRVYGALGYSLADTLKVQGGYMHQFGESFQKGQLQLSLHQSF